MRKIDPILPYLEKIKKKTESDNVLFVHHNEDCTLQIYDPEHTAESTIEVSESPSILLETLTKNIPFIENDVPNSFLFNEKIDNPFDYENVLRYGILPLYAVDDSRRQIGFFLLYQTREKKRAYEKNTFLKLRKQCEKLVKKLSEIEAWKKIIDRNCTTESTVQEKKSNEELSQAYSFFSSIVHDMRTPINATLGFLELLEDGVDKAQKEYVVAASRSAEMVASLVNDVLDFSKIKTGNLELDIHYFSPIDSFRNVAYTSYHMAWKKGVNFSIFFDPEIPFVVKSDPYRIKQIINNFLSNAIKFTPENGYVDFSLHYDKKDDFLVIKVTDTGIGIDKKSIGRIFEPFQQASKETSGKYGGTGLGLSISKYLAEKIGARIDVESELGKGSTFSLSFPCHTVPGTPSSIYVDYDHIPSVTLVEGDHPDTHHIHLVKTYFEILKIPHRILDLDSLSNEAAKDTIYIFSEFDYKQKAFNDFYEKNGDRMVLITPDLLMNSLADYQNAQILHRPLFPNKLLDKILHTLKASGRGVKKQETKREVRKNNIGVLIVDDNLINRKLMQEILKKIGVRPHLAANGEEALKLFENNEIDMIFMDEIMPGGMSGSDTIRRIRATEKGRKIPIYSLTGMSSEETVNKIRKAGATEVLFKPIKNSLLDQIIRNYSFEV
ncbi:ATP-binding response regulator [Nitratifractor sp.]